VSLSVSTSWCVALGASRVSVFREQPESTISTMIGAAYADLMTISRCFMDNLLMHREYRRDTGLGASLSEALEVIVEGRDQQA
jgi:hypothetical protein